MLKFSWTKILDVVVQIRDSEFMREMLRQREILGSNKSSMGPLDCASLYALTRWRKPRVVVETGGFLGMSSAFILKALHDEGITDSVLYSIEMMPDCPHGILIPEELRAGFVPLKGRVEDFIKRRELPDRVDMFLHDSSHRYKHMLMEFNYFWKKMDDGGLLVSHDVNMTAAFTDFVSKTYKHDKIGQNDLTRTSHYEWGRIRKLGFVIKRVQV